MANLTNILSAAAVGAGVMYMMDPDRGHRRRTDLRDALAEVGDSQLVERARRLEPMAAVREIGGSLIAARWPLLGALIASRRRSMPLVRSVPFVRSMSFAQPMPFGRYRSMPFIRQRSRGLGSRDWALLGGFLGAIATGLWLVRRSRSSGGGIEVVRTMTVEAPIERVYEFWNDFENFPRFMSHVREVRRIGPDRTHWVVNGPGGTPIEWDAVITRRAANEEIAWATVEGSLVEHEGLVRFRPSGSNATRIEVRMIYRPVGGSLGHGLAALFGRDPERAIADDLARVAAQLRGTRPAVGETRR